MTAPVDVWVDPDLSELLRSDPTLVAVADALTQAAPAAAKSRMRPTVRYVGVAAALFLAAAIPSVALSRGLQSMLGLISNPPVARNWVQATLTSPVPKNAAAGSTVVIRWKLWSRDQHGKIVPFDAGGLFARLVNPAHTAAKTAPAHGRQGQYSATIRVPSGGIGMVQVGIMGWNTLHGRTPAPVLFPITNYP